MITDYIILKNWLYHSKKFAKQNKFWLYCFTNQNNKSNCTFVQFWKWMQPEGILFPEGFHIFLPKKEIGFPFSTYIHLPNSKINQTLVSDENLMYKKFYTDKPRVCKLLKLIRVSASERESLKFLWIYFLIYISGLYCVVLCLRQTNDSLASDQRRVRWSDPDGPRLAAQGLSTHISSHQQ